mgnify:CR=1 FL=1
MGKWITASAVAMVSGFLMSVPTAVKLLLVLMALDYATGLIVAWMRKKLSSDEGLRGLLKKALVLILVAASHAVTHSAEFGFDLGSAVAMFYCVNELLSIVENCGHAGVKIPNILLQAIEKLNAVAGDWTGPERRASEKPFAKERRKK